MNVYTFGDLVINEDTTFSIWAGESKTDEDFMFEGQLEHFYDTFGVGCPFRYCFNNDLYIDIEG